MKGRLLFSTLTNVTVSSLLNLYYGHILFYTTRMHLPYIVIQLFTEISGSQWFSGITLSKLFLVSVKLGILGTENLYLVLS